MKEEQRRGNVRSNEAGNRSVGAPANQRLSDRPLGNGNVEVEVVDHAREPSWSRISAVAAVAFAIGIAWPRLAGLKLGPNAPAPTAASSAAGASETATPEPSAPGSTGTASTATSPSASAVASASASNVVAPVTLSVTRAVILNCRNSDGDTLKGKRCGELDGLDPLVDLRLRRLASCPESAGKSGRLSTVLTLDFRAKRVYATVGKSSTLTDANSLEACLKQHFQAFDLSGVTHEHPRYVVTVQTLFSASTLGDAPKGDAPPEPTAEPKAVVDPKSETKTPEPKPQEPDEEPTKDAPKPQGTLTVEWDTALVRDTPRTGSVVARLHKGDKVTVSETKGGWYRVQLPNGGDGWIYRDAFGK